MEPASIAASEAILTEQRVERRLAAVLAADVAGYSRLMGGNEEGTLARLKAVRKTLADPAIASHRGRIVKTTGDGLLVEFASAVDAVRCAVEVQRGSIDQNEGMPQDTRIEFRIGIHVGDIIIDDNDIFGDGVNIAARLEGIAEPGGVCISDDTYRQIRGKVEIGWDDLGPQNLKNIAEPMRAWRVQLSGQGVAKIKPVSPASEAPALALPDKPSIAVLPFQNMSGDPEQEYFADGIVEDIITALSHFKSLFVVARNSSFTYKNKVIDIKQVGRELGVHYVLEGSVRKASGRVRITGQLIDSLTGAHVWADRYDGKLEDIFELQDEITAKVVGQLITHVQASEIQRANRKSTASLDAYDCYWRGLAQHFKYTKSGTDAALAYFADAAELDPNFSSTYAMAAVVYSSRRQNGWMVNIMKESAEAVSLARRAIETGQTDGAALCRGGFILALFANELDFGAECTRRGLSMNPNFAYGWSYSAYVRLYLGEYDIALEHFSKNERLDPSDPARMYRQLGAALSHFFLENYAEAKGVMEQAVSEFPNFASGWRVLAISAVMAGEVGLANRATSKALQVDPSRTVSSLVPLLPLRRSADLDRYRDAFLRAGFPA
jgi:TolB-like protein/class 3 adenylate cyclase/Tfp pilus assembly protein PilF